MMGDVTFHNRVLSEAEVIAIIEGRPNIKDCHLFIQTRHRVEFWDKDNPLTNKEIAAALRDVADEYDLRGLK